MPAAPSSPGCALLRHDRRLGALVAGADEAGRGALAGPLVCAAVLFDHAVLHGDRARPLERLNDSKQLSRADREELALAVLATASAVAVRVVPAGEIDRAGLHRSNLAGLRDCLQRVHRDGAVCLVDGFTLGPDAPVHRAIVRGDATSAAIAAASVLAKVTRDRLMQRLDGIYPEYGFAKHVGYITRAHAEAVRTHGPCRQHRLSFAAACLR